MVYLNVTDSNVYVKIIHLFTPGKIILGLLRVPFKCIGLSSYHNVVLPYDIRMFLWLKVGSLLFEE